MRCRHKAPETKRCAVGQNETMRCRFAPNDTYANAITASGQIVGDYYNLLTGYHGFLFNQGSYTTLDVPGAFVTDPNGINASGQIVGYFSYTDQPPFHGFLLDQGSYTTLDVPGAKYTYANGINDLGQIVGAYVDAANNTHGFLLDQGNYTTLDPPGSTGTAANGINDAGQVVGSYVDAGGNVHGFVASPESVTIDINDTPDRSDDITLFDPGVYTQTVQARVTNNGPEGDFNLQVTPADRATLDMTTVHLATGQSTEVTITPQAVSQAPNDVTISALSQDGSEAGSAQLTIVSVTLPGDITAPDTPSGMADRIPPRIDTPFNIQLTPDLRGSGQKVTLAVPNSDLTNGLVVLNGNGESADFDHSDTLNIRGATRDSDGSALQTQPGSGGNLRLVVRVRGQDTVISPGFSVAAIPINFQQTNVQLLDGGVLEFDYGWKSDSGNPADLDQVWLGEWVTYPVLTAGLLPQPPWQANVIDPFMGWPRDSYRATPGGFPDFHSPPGGILPTAGPADHFTAVQYYGIHDFRTDNTPPDASHGWQIDIQPPIYIDRYVENIGTDDNPQWQYRIVKSGYTNTAPLLTPPPGPPPVPPGGGGATPPSGTGPGFEPSLLLAGQLSVIANTGPAAPWLGPTKPMDASRVPALLLPIDEQALDHYFLTASGVMAGLRPAAIRHAPAAWQPKEALGGDAVWVQAGLSDSEHFLS
jgi:probable HAF family extracellular repeat protein